MSKNTETVEFLLPIEGNRALPLGNEKARETAIANMKILYKLDDLDQAVFLAERISRGDMFDTDVLDERTLATWMEWAEKLRPFEDKKAFFILMELFQKSGDVFSPTDMRISKIKNTMIQIASNQNRHTENLKMQEFSLELKQEVSSMNDPNVLEVKSSIAMSHTFLGNKKEALAMSQDIANAYEQLYGELDPRTLSHYKQVEVSLVHAGYYGKAITFSKGICEKLKKAPGMKQKELETKGRIPKLFLKQLHIQGKVDEAERFLQELCAEYSAFPRSLSPEAMANVGLLSFIRSLPKVKLETLHSAAKDGNLSNLIILLKNGVDVDAEDYEGRRPIHYAAENGNNAILCALLKKGAAYNPADYKGKTPLQLTSNSEIKRSLISVENSFRDFKKGNYQMLDNYISQYSKIINAKDKNGHTLLHWATSLGNQNVVKQLLDVGAEIDQISIKGNTPLHIAVSNGHKEIVESLLQSARRDNRNAFINAKTTNRGTTALHAAAEKGDSKIVDVLLRNGAKYNAQTHDGETAIQLSKDQTVIDILKLTDDLFTRVRNGDLEVIEKLRRLEAHDFEMVINACDMENHTLLQVANDCGRKKMADEIEKISNMLIKTN
ncbi:UNVERIFIED_CONTAM: Ank3 [Trichonephila clavipes]